MPPPASGLPARLVLGPALRAQSDRRLVRLVREGYEGAFEEIVRRYRRPLDRFAASIVGGRSEDVTQDSFRKALVALRDGEGDLDLRPWLYRIVRNTALNDLRDRPPAAAELTDDLIGGGRSAAVEAEQREEMAKLTARMLALPTKQRAALVMRELEGMGHEEIATALGVSGGAARQAIARGRAAVRSGFGALLPLPLMRGLLGGADGASEAAIGGAGAAVGGGAVATGGAGAAAVGAGGLGAGAAMKLGLATVAAVGSIGAGVAIDHHGGGHHRSDPPQAAAPAPGGPRGDGVRSTPSPVLADVEGSGRSPVEVERRHIHGGDGGGDRRGHRGGPGEDHGRDDSHGRGDHGPDDGSRLAIPTESGTKESDQDRRGGKASDGRGSSGSDGDDRDHSGQGSTSGHGGPSSDKSGDGDSRGGSGRSQGGSGSGGASGSGSTRGGHGSDDAPAEVVGTVPAESSSSGDSGSTSGGSDSDGGSESSGGPGSSDAGTDTVTSSPSTSDSGSSGGPSTSSLGSTSGGRSSSSGGSEISEISP
jgi:RNA polymerase sigma factor (sigma-70 family)